MATLYLFKHYFNETPLDPSPSHTTAVKAILSTISLANMQANSNTLMAYNNRYYK